MIKQPGGLSGTSGEPFRRGEAGGFLGLHGGQAGQHILKILTGVDAEWAEIFYDDGNVGVEWPVPSLRRTALRGEQEVRCGEAQVFQGVA